mmetsp:Transcript_29167/g.45107  ORF Transcript_29167/g.45107 Transcript_29167/m.45107 type:complete len:83 (-) Transcript_29167:46-294(-)
MQVLELSGNQFTRDIFIGNLPDGIVICLDGSPVDREELVKNCSIKGAHIQVSTKSSFPRVGLRSGTVTLAHLTEYLSDDEWE